MRICLVSREYPTDEHGGGIGTYTEKTARALAQLGHGVDVVTEALVEPSVSLEEGVTIHRLAKPRAPRLRTLARAHAVWRQTCRLDSPPDIVQACEYGAEAAWLAARRTPRARLVTRLATPSFVVREFVGAHQDRRGPSEALVDRLERFQTERSDAVIAISRALAEVVSARWRVADGRMEVLKTGVDFASRHSETAGALPSWLAGRDYVLFFGRLEERKGVHILARTLPEVLDRHPQVEVVLAGQSMDYQGIPMAEFVRSSCPGGEDRIHILPRQPQADLHRLLESALVVVLPSIWEGLGNAALEAIDMGKPVIVTSGSGLAEVIEDGRSGVVVPPGDVSALEAALLRLLVDGPLRDRLAAGARARAGDFELKKVTKELVGFYERVLSVPRGAPIPSR